MGGSRLIVSLDFELFWGMQDCRELNEYKNNILGGRKAIPRLLKLFSKYGIHASWAAVGFLFADSVEEIREYMPGRGKLPDYNNATRSSYRLLDQIGEDSETRAYYFAPSLIKKIASTPGMEIACHTFSHYYCREEGQSIDQFKADLQAAKAIAMDKGYSLSSLVLPRNESEREYIRILEGEGFIAFRDEEHDWIHRRIGWIPLKRALRLVDVYLPLTGQGGYIPQKEDGVWNLTGSRMYKPLFKKLYFLEGLKLHRIKRQMLHAAKNGLVFHLWWHPHNIGIYTGYHLKQLEEIFKYYQYLQKRYGMKSLNMREMVEELEA